MTAIDYAALVGRLRADAEVTDDIGLCADAADAIERLMDELAAAKCANHDEYQRGWNAAIDLYSATDLARLIAERDAAKQKHALLETEFLRSREAAGQIIVGRDVTIANLRDEVASLTAELAEARRINDLAAIDHTNAMAMIKSLESELAELREQKPVAYVVMDEDGPGFCAGWESACHEHINDAIIEYDITEAAKWKVVPVYSRPVPSAHAVPDGDALLFAAEAKQCNHDCKQGRNCMCGGGK